MSREGSGAGIGTRTVTQVAFVVPEIERSAEACSALVGLPSPQIHEPNPADSAARGLSYRGQPLGGGCRSAFFHLDNIGLELLQPVEGPNTWLDFLQEHDAGGHHIAFVVDDADTRLLQVAELGFPTIQTGRRRIGGSYGYADATKELGVFLELLGDPERAAASLDEATKRTAREERERREAARAADRALPPPEGLGTRMLRMIALAVPDADRAGERFAATLGLDTPETRSSAELGIEGRHRGQPVEFAVEWKRFRVDGGLAVEFARPLSGPSTQAELLAERGAALHHLTFSVDDLEAARGRLDALGFPTIFEGEWPGGRIARADARSALGVYIEVVEQRN